ncbi:CoA-binding protein [Sphingomonas aerophila]|uniref:Acyl-CoA synthetase (NDP forming) n=1 Tax=Sphingomonas aerophila TaxID=1344948 RepID=A0A7W9ETR5_9SPHN|nr:CoA-binding protein [Sphingomonas aerophila]MBB5714484.1 acyl-CoA synthetase (NDP forming) [Sphingomonas aerophila]
MPRGTRNQGAVQLGRRRFSGPIRVVNPKPVYRDGVQWAASVAALDQVPDLAIVVTPAAAVPAVIDELGSGGTKVAVVLSSGLDAAQRTAMLEAAGVHRLRIVGPNSLGVLLPRSGCNASFAARRSAPGKLAFLSQSGAVVTAMADWAADKQVGFSAMVSMGEMADVDAGDLVDFYAVNPNTDAILLYLEGLTNGAKFLSAARTATRVKPVIAIRPAKANRPAERHKRTVAHWQGATTYASRHCGEQA